MQRLQSFGHEGRIHAVGPQAVDSHMTKYFFYEHSQSMGVPSFIPEEAELRQDIGE